LEEPDSLGGTEMRFIVYNPLGQILRHGSCPDVDFLHQAHNPGETVMEGEADDSKHCIVDGEVVEFSAEKKEEEAAIKLVEQVADDKERIIRLRMDYILRTQAITELTKEGKL
jgi:hypothetical protein